MCYITRHLKCGRLKYTSIFWNNFTTLNSTCDANVVEPTSEIIFSSFFGQSADKCMYAPRYIPLIEPCSSRLPRSTRRVFTGPGGRERDAGFFCWSAMSCPGVVVVDIEALTTWWKSPTCRSLAMPAQLVWPSSASSAETLFDVAAESTTVDVLPCWDYRKLVAYGSSMSGLHFGRHCRKCVEYRCIWSGHQHRTIVMKLPSSTPTLYKRVARLRLLTIFAG